MGKFEFQLVQAKNIYEKIPLNLSCHASVRLKNFFMHFTASHCIFLINFLLFCMFFYFAGIVSPLIVAQLKHKKKIFAVLEPISRPFPISTAI